MTIPLTVTARKVRSKPWPRRSWTINNILRRAWDGYWGQRWRACWVWWWLTGGPWIMWAGHVVSQGDLADGPGGPVGYLEPVDGVGWAQVPESEQLHTQRKQEEPRKVDCCQCICKQYQVAQEVQSNQHVQAAVMNALGCYWIFRALTCVGDRLDRFGCWWPWWYKW